MLPLKVSCGASQYVKVAKVNNINDAIRELKERGITVFATDMNGDDNLDGNDLSNASLVASSLAEIDFVNRTIVII